MKYYCFIKGINVGGNSLVPMSKLIEQLSKILDCHITSFLSSGNLIIKDFSNLKKLEETVIYTLRNEFNVDTTVFIVKEDELERIKNDNPFSEEEADKSKQLVYFLKGHVNIKDIDEIRNNESIVESYYYMNDVLYVYYKNGVGRSKLTTRYIDRIFSTQSTGRNINTLENISNK